jgi:hypothetical protein
MHEHDRVHTEAMVVPAWPHRFRPFSFAAGVASICGFPFFAYRAPELFSDEDLGIWWLAISTTMVIALLTHWLIEHSGYFSIGLAAGSQRTWIPNTGQGSRYLQGEQHPSWPR